MAYKIIQICFSKSICLPVCLGCRWWPQRLRERDVCRRSVFSGETGPLFLPVRQQSCQKCSRHSAWPLWPPAPAATRHPAASAMIDWPQNWGGTFKGTQVGCSGRPDWNLPLQKKTELKTFWVNEQMFLQGAQRRKQWKYDSLVALLCGCGSLMWPFVELALKALWGKDGGLKTIINKGLLTLSVPFSIERVERAKLDEICAQEAAFLIFILFDFLPWVKVAYLKHLVHCKCHECTVWCYTDKENPHNLWCNCSDVSMCADNLFEVLRMIVAEMFQIYVCLTVHNPDKGSGPL